MIRSGIAVVLVVLLGLFGYFLLTDTSGRTRGEKAKDAAVRVGDTVVDQSVAAAVRVALLGKFKHDARFLHVYHADANILVYGLLPATVSVEDVTAVARKVPGVEQVEVLVRARPAYVGAEGSGADAEP
jgi:osmotically-inducible protein OsmY